MSLNNIVSQGFDNAEGCGWWNNGHSPIIKPDWYEFTPSFIKVPKPVISVAGWKTNRFPWFVDFTAFSIPQFYLIRFPQALRLSTVHTRKFMSWSRKQQFLRSGDNKKVDDGKERVDSSKHYTLLKGSFDCYSVCVKEWEYHYSHRRQIHLKVLNDTRWSC